MGRASRPSFLDGRDAHPTNLWKLFNSHSLAMVRRFCLTGKCEVARFLDEQGFEPIASGDWIGAKPRRLTGSDQEFLDGTRHVIYPWNQSKI
ncbi:hypothetical protein QUB70_32175 [Microcoleus sp. A003_D6]|uniref:hypothetical protein n=1 Tax=Microcoleus sp. A003_D6 TaxID=3055266 RepID=UPI002FD35BCE